MGITHWAAPAISEIRTENNVLLLCKTTKSWIQIYLWEIAKRDIPAGRACAHFYLLLTWYHDICGSDMSHVLFYKLTGRRLLYSSF